ncbi:hypothetical protein [Agreia pratensis]|uniref:MinD-like ATPase involved in chromosome partitioning or flagellar assembly n=1 Tax=Agreia pratensis TaxID=150121 RepID=A0A1X7JM45_9MICO|nr:hypothetical protein [Agreia pratensis]SMG28985.1 hypothetical protein SAMN06296010_1529 [Agreia pratensis]
MSEPNALSPTSLWETATSQNALEKSLADVAVSVPTVRRIAFLTPSADVDTASVCRLTAQTLARHRSGRVVTTSQVAGPEIAAHSIPSAEQLSALPTSLHESLSLDRLVWVADPDIDDRFFDIHCIDWGMQGPATGALEAAASAHAICVVAPFDRPTAESAVALATALATRTDSTPTVIAFTNATRQRGSWARSVGPYLSVPSIVFDRSLTGPESRIMRRRNQRSLTYLAAALLTASLRPGAPSPARAHEVER